ncbi:MAG: hypothetical protein Q8P02_02740 [Candidatus Micrarchaeota archaeon]|nr:hypothetical protein [Candidatus Micrarchaeota archaeon]
MAIKDEVLQMLEMLKKAGLNPVDAVFEGAVGVKEDTVLGFMDKLDEKQLVSGVIRIIYTSGENHIRFVEIPVGQGGEEQLAQQAGAGSGGQ